MPTTYAHYKFGREVLGALPGPLRNSIEKNRELFDIGLHGPDILFYYRVVMKNHVNRLGYAMHDKNADEFFERALKILQESPDKGAARAYLYGFICHFALDSECHNYIEKMIQESGLTHSEIEMEFDRSLLVEDGIDPVSYLACGHIHATQKNAEVIAPFFENVTARELKKSLSYLIFCHKVLLAPGKKKRKALLALLRLVGMYQLASGMIMSLSPNPACDNFCRVLRRQFAGAVPVAAGLISQYQKVLLEGKEMPGRFHQTFGAGEHWEELCVS